MDSITIGIRDVPVAVCVRQFKKVRYLRETGWIKTDYSSSR